MSTAATSPFKPGVRYFVLPNYMELDQPMPCALARQTMADRVRAELAKRPGTAREIARRLRASIDSVNGGLAQLKERGELTYTERPRHDGAVWFGKAVERVYALK